MTTILRLLISTTLLLAVLGQAHAHSKSEITQLITRIRHLPISQKVQETSEFFLGDRTRIGPLGEGKKGKFDRDPLFSFKAFDCTTYVETVMALALSQDLKSFFRNILDIRYRDGIISHQRRNHFTSLDWIPNNAKFLNDITASIGPIKYAHAIIDKKSWYQNMGPQNIRRPDVTEQNFRDLLKEFKNLGKDFKPQKATLPYITLKTLFKNPAHIRKIPHGAIINIVRPNWDLTNSIGTHLNISHQGIAIWNRGKLYYRHASSFPHKIVKDTAFKDYFRKYLDSETLKGINIQEL
ncbi:MAG: DUF1460 domain-containing protein [Deltaproteobacteria bacterium]|nr:MAG: DUF1460 domain-containing protein [Deltaproteobacteria bacterium]